MDTINVKRDILRDILSLFSGLLKQEQIAKSTALATNLVIKAGPGTLYKLVASSAGAQYIQLHDSATLPADAAVPVMTFYVAANGVVELPIHSIKGLKFTTGIVVCRSSTAATKTIGAGAADCWFHAIYT